MPNTWNDFVKSQKGSRKSKEMLSHEWKNKQGNLVTLNIGYVDSLVREIDDLRKKISELKAYCNYLECVQFPNK